MIELIDTGFKLINMLILSIILFYIFYAYILPILKTEMLNEQAANNTFENKKLLLTQEAESVKKKIAEESLDQEVLKQKLLFWNSSIDQVRMSKKIAKQLLVDELYNRKCSIQKKQLLIETKQNALAVTFTKAQKDLELFFSNEKNGTEYIEQLIDNYSLKESI